MQPLLAIAKRALNALLYPHIGDSACVPSCRHARFLEGRFDAHGKPGLETISDCADCDAIKQLCGSWSRCRASKRFSKTFLFENLAQSRNQALCHRPYTVHIVAWNVVRLGAHLSSGREWYGGVCTEVEKGERLSLVAGAGVSIHTIGGWLRGASPPPSGYVTTPWMHTCDGRLLGTLHAYTPDVPPRWPHPQQPVGLLSP